MNNGMWHDQLVHLAQQDRQREIDQLLLLKEAGLDRPNRLARVGRELLVGLLALGRRVKEHKAVEPTSYKPANPKTIL
jgi:hypothetical protein